MITTKIFKKTLNDIKVLKENTVEKLSQAQMLARVVTTYAKQMGYTRDKEGNLVLSGRPGLSACIED